MRAVESAVGLCLLAACATDPARGDVPPREAESTEREDPTPTIENEDPTERARRRIAANPNDPNAYAALAAALLDDRDLDGVLDAGRRALELDDGPTSVPVRLTLADALLAKSETDGAFECLREVIEIDANCARAHAGIANILGKRDEDYELAIDAARRAVELAPDDPVGHAALLRWLERSDAAEDALKAALPAIRAGVKSAAASLLRNAKACDPQRVAAIAAECVRGDGNDAYELLFLAVSSHRGGDAARARALHRRALEWAAADGNEITDGLARLFSHSVRYLDGPRH